jgi:carbon-monoxide dehydrogenase medium subunit
MNEMTNTHILINRFAYYEPATLEEALALLEEHGSHARLLAGGTDLFVQLKMERNAPEVVIYIGRIPGLDQIKVGDSHLQVGALASILSLQEHPSLKAHYPAVAEACASFSTIQVQTMGTVGGNLGNGSPAADSAPALIAYDAQIQLTSLEGERRLPLEQFFLGPGKTALKPGELITQVILPRPEKNSGSAFLKISRVEADIAKASAAVMIVRDARQDTIKDCRMVFGSVAPTPLRTRKAESVLIGRKLDDALAMQAARAAAEEIMPIDDVRSTAWYRREAVRAMTYDALMSAWQRSGYPEAVDWEEEDIPVVEDERLPGAAPGLRMGADEKRQIELEVNGRRHLLWVSSNDLLLNVLRDQLQLTGTKYGCGIGECSACTVLIDGRPSLACLVLAVSVAGKEILTIEGLQKPNGDLDVLQEAFIDYAAYQCGYCTPGMIMTAKSLLMENPMPTEDDVRYYLRGNLCRCTGYASIVRAVINAATSVTEVT